MSFINGGITLGGGEPLLHCQFLIDDIFTVYGKQWHVTAETSLHVIPWMLFDMAPYIDEYVVDIKDMNPDIYKLYSRPLKSFDKCDVIHPWPLAYYFEQVQKNPHGSFEVVGSCSQ